MSDSKSSTGRRPITPFAFIDTEGFRSAGLNWDSRNWKSLAELAADQTIHPITTSITRREVESRLYEALDEAETAAKKHIAMFAQLGDGNPLGAGDRDARAARLKRSFADYLEGAKFVEVPIKVDIDAVLNDYFSGQPPFGAGKKKSEFPDALVMKSLDRWVRKKQVSCMWSARIPISWHIARDGRTLSS